MNYGKFVLNKMLKTKEKVALINGATGEQITFGDMVQAIVNTATSLKSSDMRRGEVVAFCSENRSEFLITAIALWCNGFPVTFINLAYSKDDFIHTLDISKPAYIFLSKLAHDKFSSIISETDFVDKLYVFGNEINGESFSNFMELDKKHTSIEHFMKSFEFQESPTALILYSSGTTGLPKGAKITHSNLIYSGSQPSCVEKDLVCFGVTPWVNTIGIIFTMKDILKNRPVVYLPGFKEDKYLRCIQQYKVGKLIAVPPLIVMLAKSSLLNNYDTSSVEVIYSAGATLDLAIMNKMKSRLPNLRYILQGYGMTESTGVIIEETEKSIKTGTIGKIIAGNIVKVADVETGKVLGPNQEGELCFKGPGLFTGYIKLNLNDDLDADGYFRTGDIVYYDEEGFYYYVERIKELIKYKAGQVAPSELEAVLLQHPEVADAAVVGTPDVIAGELPTAFVVKKSDSKVAANELIDMVSSKVSSWKQLKGGVYFVDHIPKTTSGKILRKLLRDRIKSNNIEN